MGNHNGSGVHNENMVLSDFEVDNIVEKVANEYLDDSNGSVDGKKVKNKEALVSKSILFLVRYTSISHLY